MRAWWGKAQGMYRSQSVKVGKEGENHGDNHAVERVADDLFKSPFFNPPQALLDLEVNDPTPLEQFKNQASVLDLAPMEEVLPIHKKKGTLARLKASNRNRSASEAPRPSWDIFNQPPPNLNTNSHSHSESSSPASSSPNNSGINILSIQGHPPEAPLSTFGFSESGSQLVSDSDSPVINPPDSAPGSQSDLSVSDSSSSALLNAFAEGVPVDISLLSLAAAAASLEENSASSPQVGSPGGHSHAGAVGTWKKLTYRTLRKKSFNSTVTQNDEAYKLASILQEQRIPETIITKMENGNRRLVMEGSKEHLCRLLCMQTEVQSDYVDVFLSTFRYFCTGIEVLDEIMWAQREACIDMGTEEGAQLGKATVVEWNESVEKHLLTVILKWYSHHHLDFAQDIELDLKLRDFLQSDVFEDNTRVNIPNFLEKMDKVKEAHEKWEHDTKLMIQYRNAIDRHAGEIMRKTSTKSIFELHITAAVKALCLLEMEIFQKIPAWEFSTCAWMSKKCEQEAPMIYEHIIMFNKISNWVATEVVLTGNIDMRANLIERFITMARQAREWNNFNSCFQIVLGLHNPAVLKLKTTWSKVARKYVTALKEVNELVNPEKNHRAYRTVLAKTTPPCIPYVGMYLKDLLFANDGSKTFLPNDHINFGKLNTIGMTISAIRRFQSVGYAFEDDATLVSWFRHHTFAMDENELLLQSKKLIESSEV